MQGQLKTWQASHVGRVRLHLILKDDVSSNSSRQRRKTTTFRLRQLLQFMASRGSLDTRRAGRRSMPIWGLDIAAASDCETSVDIGALRRERQDASSGGEQAYEDEQDVGKKKAQVMRREM
jgi:hypothetical protein